MDTDLSSSTYDRDLDVPVRPPTGPSEPTEVERRLVVNPFLAVVGAFAAVLLLRISLQSHNLALFLASMGLLGASGFFTQLHCLDCGATTWLVVARRHACEAAFHRQRDGRPSRWPFPRLKTQVVLWLYVIASVSTLLLILFAGGH